MACTAFIEKHIPREGDRCNTKGCDGVPNFKAVVKGAAEVLCCDQLLCQLKAEGVAVAVGRRV